MSDIRKVTSTDRRGGEDDGRGSALSRRQVFGLSLGIALLVATVLWPVQCRTGYVVIEPAPDSAAVQRSPHNVGCDSVLFTPLSYERNGSLDDLRLRLMVVAVGGGLVAFLAAAVLVRGAYRLRAPTRREDGAMDQDGGCLFCTIIAGDEPAEFVAEEEDVVAFEDKFPRAPVHVLVAPRQHVPSAHDLTEEHSGLVWACVDLAQRVAEEAGIGHGYRIATNIGSEGGQAIPHLHFHVLGGKQLGHVDGVE